MLLTREKIRAFKCAYVATSLLTLLFLVTSFVPSHEGVRQIMTFLNSTRSQATVSDTSAACKSILTHFIHDFLGRPLGRRLEAFYRFHPALRISIFSAFYMSNPSHPHFTNRHKDNLQNTSSQYLNTIYPVSKQLSTHSPHHSYFTAL